MEFFVVALATNHRHDPVLKTPLNERVGEFPFHPHGLHRLGRKNDDEPIAPAQRLPNLLLPLLRAPEMRPAIPNADTMSPKRPRQSIGKTTITGGVGKEHFPGLEPRFAFQTLAGVSSNPCST